MMKNIQASSVLIEKSFEMIRTVRSCCYQNKLCTDSFTRSLSAQAAVSLKPNEEEYANAIPFKEIPGLSKFEFLRRFMPGGKFYKASYVDIQKNLRNELGDFFRLPEVFGQKASLWTFNADDVAFIFRNEGTYPYRRGPETMKHFRENIRSDVYEVGGLLTE